MPFYVQGPGVHELMPHGKIFKGPVVEKVEAIVAEHAIGKDDHAPGKEKADQRHTAAQAYQTVRALPQASLILLARQIMVSPVQRLSPQATV